VVLLFSGLGKVSAGLIAKLACLSYQISMPTANHSARFLQTADVIIRRGA
jgi:hypothetical protein